MKLDKRLFIWLLFAFIIETVLLTLTHEYGHYVVARYLGYDASISYGSTNWWVHTAPQHPINPADDFYITLGGLCQTMMTGIIGSVLLFYFRKSFESANQLSIRQWTLVFVSLFVVRPVVNIVVGLGRYVFTGEFSKRGDEIKIAHYLQIPELMVLTIVAIIGAAIVSLIIFKFIPVKQRLTFIASAVLGGSTGYVLWLVLLGKYILP